ncbi:sensor histidine kinase [Amycolatopsis pigmentata]|uniref:histidine kinase n=1 Tax=Amycolatopsis pigmentata TaxID=450801 RepID=A0ABW5G174_9PSEU
MNARERRTVEAITAHLAHARQVPGPGELARVVGTASGASGCALTVAGVRHQWGDGAGPWLEHPVRYDGEDQGVLAVSPDSAGPLTAVAAVLGAPVAIARLEAETGRLRDTGDAAARALAEDRWRAAVEMEAERRGLERDLHDGAQHHLVALRMAISVAEHAGGETDGPESPLPALLTRLDNAERVLVDTASGVLPVALAAEGLAGALDAELAGDGDVLLDIDGLRRRYPPPVESAVYFSCLEAVNNAHKHAPGADVTVIARDSHGGLEFAVADTGPGFTAPVRNSGLHNLSTRVAAVGGRIEISSVPGRGTAVRGFVPH